MKIVYPQSAPAVAYALGVYRDLAHEYLRDYPDDPETQRLRAPIEAATAAFDGTGWMDRLEWRHLRIRDVDRIRPGSWIYPDDAPYARAWALRAAARAYAATADPSVGISIDIDAITDTFIDPEEEPDAAYWVADLLRWDIETWFPSERSYREYCTWERERSRPFTAEHLAAAKRFLDHWFNVRHTQDLIDAARDAVRAELAGEDWDLIRARMRSNLGRPAPYPRHQPMSEEEAEAYLYGLIGDPAP